MKNNYTVIEDDNNTDKDKTALVALMKPGEGVGLV